jgi:hypothetical protein
VLRWHKVNLVCRSAPLLWRLRPVSLCPVFEPCWHRAASNRIELLTWAKTKKGWPSPFHFRLVAPDMCLTAEMVPAAFNQDVNSQILVVKVFLQSTVFEAVRERAASSAAVKSGCWGKCRPSRFRFGFGSSARLAPAGLGRLPEVKRSRTGFIQKWRPTRGSACGRGRPPHPAT